MSVNLGIDWGNSRVKVGVFKNGRLDDIYNFSEHEATSEIERVVSEVNPNSAIICSVTRSSSDAEKMLEEQVKKVVKLDEHTPLPIMNAYSSPGTLGADRIALAVAAHSMHPDKNNLIVSVGTCITYNFIQNTRTFRGGTISPGVNLRLKAMHEFTDGLPAVSMEGETLLLGYDTETGIRGGAICGVTAEIDGMVTEFAAQYPDFNALLTGGDAPLFEGRLKSKIFADPNLLLKGLNIILKHNVPYAY